MQDFYELRPASARLRTAIEELYRLDADFARIEAEAGPVTTLQLPPTFAALVRIVIGQQLATRVARVIFQKLAAAVPLEPDGFLQASDAELAAAGLSRAKQACCRALAQALNDGSLNLAACEMADDQSVWSALTAIRGVGPWTAEIFMLFGLQRLDVFPGGDLALQRAYAQLKGIEPAPKARALTAYVEPLRPYRGVAALLLWHAYRHATGFGPA